MLFISLYIYLIIIDYIYDTSYIIIVCVKYVFGVFIYLKNYLRHLFQSSVDPTLIFF